jgi:hypothetical protein
MMRLPDDEHDGDEAGDLRRGNAECKRDAAGGRFGLTCAAHWPGEGRQEHEHEHHGEVLDDEPAHGDAPALGLDQPPLLHRAQQHDGARHRQRETENDTRTGGPAEPVR